MKLPLLFILSAACLLAATPSSAPTGAAGSPRIVGAWRSTVDVTRMLLVADGYFVQSKFDAGQRAFEGTFGGPFTLNNGRVRGKIEFNSIDPTQVGSDFALPLSLDGDRLVIGEGDERETWTRLDSGQAVLAGAWHLTGRETNGRMSDVPASPRRMLKLVTEKRYQWITFETASGSVASTGGGTYTYQNGNYTETIEFFAGNASRVGMTLPFTGEIKDGKWHHRGKSSAGDALFQVWSRP